MLFKLLLILIIKTKNIDNKELFNKPKQLIS